MNLANYFWYFKSALTPRFCDEVVKYALEKKDTMAITGGYGRDRNLDKNGDYLNCIECEDRLKINERWDEVCLDCKIKRDD